ncbi:hypothetical protein MRA01_63180 [Methylobacterium radiotolerans]|nr:hypothetical protein MRA01_63180 [Methylobacterium radiotolerans]
MRLGDDQTGVAGEIRDQGLATVWRLARSRHVANAPARTLKLSWSQIQPIDREWLSPTLALAPATTMCTLCALRSVRQQALRLKP